MPKLEVILFKEESIKIDKRLVSRKVTGSGAASTPDQPSVREGIQVKLYTLSPTNIILIEGAAYVLRPLPRSPRVRNTYWALTEYLRQSLKTNPSEGVKPAVLAKQLGVSRQRIHQLYDQIAKEQSVPPKVIEVHRQNKQQRKQEQELKRQKQSQIKNRVIELRLEGVGDRKISKLLDIPLSTVSCWTAKLVKEGKIPRMRNTRSPEQIKNFYSQVKELRYKGLTQRQIAEELGTPLFQVVKAIYRLLKVGEAERKAPFQTRQQRVAERAEFLKNVTDLRKQGLSNSKIANMLRTSDTRVDTAVHQLIQSGEIVRRKRGRKKSSSE